jgi:glycosyltransferase involved in cell wall biosynthesis
LRRRLGVPTARVTLQHGGVGPQFFADPPGPRRGVLFVGTWIERKGVLDLVPALATLLDRRPGTPVTVAGCGVPAEQVLADFPERHRPRVRVVPQITDEDALADLYLAHAVFAFPSTFEGLPLAVLEAAAAGLAVVTTGVCGMKDTICDGRTGLLVPVGDPGQLAAALERLVADPGLASRLGGAARESVRHYTWRRSAEQFLDACQATRHTGGR